jgi:hypothetical protein
MALITVPRRRQRVPRLATATVAALSIGVVAVSATSAPTADRKSSLAPHAGFAPQSRLFRTAESCLACHNNLATSTGEDVSIGAAWRASMMANSSRDPYWQASVRRETLDHSAESATIEDECAACHMPMTRFEARAAGARGSVFAHLPAGKPAGTPNDSLAADGVSCTLCHQILDERLGAPESFNGGFAIDLRRPMGTRPVFGPFDVDSGRTTIMHSSSEYRPTAGMHMRASELCATCHTLYTTALDASGRAVGRLPEQVPFQEWKHSAYSSGAGARSCQSCHMPRVTDSVAITGVWGQPRPGLARHDFRGGNFFMLRMLERFRSELGVVAPSDEMQRSIQRTVEHLQSEAARLTLENGRVADGRLSVDVVVENLTGHKLPTAYPSRRAWLRVTVTDGRGARLFESGALTATGAIAGNDNDRDASAFEPHYTEITAADQVQIYESMMVDAGRRVTTGLLLAVDYVKDNRIPPAGFDKATAHRDIAVRGSAAEDADFRGGSDRVRFVVDVSRADGDVRVEAELLYQPIAFRWAENLKSYRADEIRRFTSYYEAMGPVSATVLARAAATIR